MQPIHIMCAPKTFANIADTSIIQNDRQNRTQCCQGQYNMPDANLGLISYLISEEYIENHDIDNVELLDKQIIGTSSWHSSRSTGNDVSGK